MKRFLILSLVSVSAFAVSCTDVSSMLEELEYLDGRADAAAAWIAEMEQEASGLASILKAMTANDCIVDMDFVYDEETLEPLSCTIYFDKSDPVVIQLKGQGGDQGPEGDGGRRVMISAALDDGIYYWTADGEWILDAGGNRVPVATESDFRMKVDGELWYASFDAGQTWVEMSPYVYEFGGVTDVITSEEKVSFVMQDGSVVNVPMRTDISFTLSREGCREAVAGATYTISYTFSGVEDGVVSVVPGRYMGHAEVSSSAPGRGTVTYTISELHDISRQKLLVLLTHSRGTVSRLLTFRESGTLELGPVEPVSPDGGECVLSTKLTGYSYMNVDVVSGGDWFRFTSTSSAGYVYDVAPNRSEESRVAEVCCTVMDKYLSVLFTKKIQIVQFGTASLAGYYDYLGSWTMSATDAITGNSVSGSVRIIKNEGVENGYVIYGLSPGSGENLPVYASFDSGTRCMTLDLPQRHLDDTDTGLYPVAYSGGSLSLIGEAKTFTFRVKDNQMTADMNSDATLIYMNESGDILPDDYVLYSEATFTRDGVASTYQDGQVVVLNQASAGLKPLNLIILGDGYQSKDLRQGGKFERSARGAMNSFFAVEPFTTFKNRFNVYMVPYASVDDGPDITSAGIVKDTYFSSVCAGGGNTLVTCNYDRVMDVVDMLGMNEENYDLYRTVVILLVNTTEQSGSCWYVKAGRTDTSNVGDGIKSMAIATLAADTMGANGLIRHEAGGHAFGRLADEYNWGGTADDSKKASLIDQQNNYGFYFNVTAETGDASPWAHFIGLEGYDDVGYYEGAWGCSTGLYRPTQSSIMLNNQGKFNAPSREIIYKRIILQTEGPGAYDLDKFLEYDRKNL